jgi:hypothetical protein
VCDADEAPAHTDRTASLDANPLLRPEHCDSEYAISLPQCQADIVAELRLKSCLESAARSRDARRVPAGMLLAPRTRNINAHFGI